MTRYNTLVICSDQHARDVLGAYGHDVVKTPNLDRLAARGIRFTSAYCNSPICVPSRASMATGRYIHQLGTWDNAHPYDGSVRGWAHELRDNGARAVSIGKLHYLDEVHDYGFSDALLPLHVLNGEGDLAGLIRRGMDPRPSVASLARNASRGDSSYQRYDDKIIDASCAWLDGAAKADNTPWTMFVSLVAPHPPMIARPEFFDLYPKDLIPEPEDWDGARAHPFIAALRRNLPYDDYFDDEARYRTFAAYFGLVSFLDHNIGRLLAHLEASGFAETTRVIYVSDHGESLGRRGLWSKMNLFEEGAAVPMIMAGPGLPEGRVNEIPVSLVDLYPTILDNAGVALPEDKTRPGASLNDIAQGAEEDRSVLSELHCVGTPTGAFMLRWSHYKYIDYVGMPPSLFDLKADPGERTDLALDPACAGLLAEARARMLEICDPEAVNARAFADQEARIAHHGGAEAILSRGFSAYTPAPGEPVESYPTVAEPAKE